jgi:hypothetical protein
MGHDAEHQKLQPVRFAGLSAYAGRYGRRSDPAGPSHGENSAHAVVEREP